MCCPVCGSKEVYIYEKTYSKKDMEYFFVCDQCSYQWVESDKPEDSITTGWGFGSYE